MGGFGKGRQNEPLSGVGETAPSLFADASAGGGDATGAEKKENVNTREGLSRLLENL